MTIVKDDLFAENLRRRRLSITLPRLQILKLLSGREAQTIAQLLALCQRQFDKSTLYRNIKSLEKAGLIQKVADGWQYRYELSDDFKEHHHHLTCLKCHQIITFTKDLAIKNLVNSISKDNNFKSVSHQFEIQGYCPNCYA